MKKIPRTAKIGRGRRPSPIWLSEEFFESNYFQIGQAGQMNVSEHFPNNSEHFRRLPKILEDDRKRSEDVSIVHQ